MVHKKIKMPERDILKKSAARQAKSIIDDNGQFCSADQMKCPKGTVYP